MTSDPARGALRVLLLDDLGAEAGALTPLERALSEEGASVRRPRLGGEPSYLKHTRWLDWMGAARRAFDALIEDGAAQGATAHIVGAGVGALLGFALAHERGARVASVALIAAPVRLRVESQALLRLVGRGPLRHALPQGALAALSKRLGRPDPTLALPLSVALEIHEALPLIWDRADRTRAPILLLHGRRDRRAPVEGIEAFFSALKTPKRQIKIYPRADHQPLRGLEAAQVLADLQGHFRAHEAP